jgi:hypothetical protein
MFFHKRKSDPNRPRDWSCSHGPSGLNLLFPLPSCVHEVPLFRLQYTVLDTPAVPRAAAAVARVPTQDHDVRLWIQLKPRCAWSGSRLAGLGNPRLDAGTPSHLRSRAWPNGARSKGEESLSSELQKHFVKSTAV